VGPMQKGIAQRIGAACEMSPEAITHDWGATNYSSARTVQIEDNRSYDTDRADLADQGLGWIWSETLLDAQLMGDARLRAVDAAEFRRVRWVGDARPWVDPVSQAQAVEVMLALGLTTLRDEAAALGKDWEELAEQRAVERAYLAEFGEESEVAPVDEDEEPDTAESAAA
jgi:capsid protein